MHDISKLLGKTGNKAWSVQCLNHFKIHTVSFIYNSFKEFYVETICDGEPAKTVTCPQQNVISTVWASYGRQHPDTCVDDNQVINVTCKADYDTVLSMVQESCDDSNSCTLESNKDEYGDPPECQGVRKYLQVYYLCKSGEISVNGVVEKILSFIYPTIEITIISQREIHTLHP